MVAQASGLWMWVGKFARPLRGVGVLAMLNARLDRMGCGESVCEIPLGAGVVRLLLPGIAVGKSIDHHCVENGVQVTQ